MGFWQLENGTMVEMVFDEEGKFIKFGDDVTEENAEKAREEITIENSRQARYMQLVDMIEKGVPFEEIAAKCGEYSCVNDYKLNIPDWCHEDADCHDCWVKCLNKYFGD
jgi:hypothetical protein